MIRDSFTHILNTLRHNKAVQIGFILLFLAAGVLIMVNFDLPDAKAFIRAHRGQAVLISIVIYFLMGFTFIPASPLTLFLAVFMGPWETVLVATIGNTLAALLEYQIGSTVGDIFNFEAKMQNLPLGLGKLPITSPYLLMAGRLLPLGKRGFSIVCGAYQVPYGKYLWTTVLMYIINAAFIAFTGAGLLRLFQI
ncbi:MAG: VTT domain-containing protein [Brevefilum sp.]|nr:VTT domain-containing protein [Brevefilum sp.]